ncbi:MAG: hypothetical protein A2942_04650 [Candidatus Lloydbacteria bacterium RIFCSPLOWO2_01_FULL_50_20]|uniref:NIF system FeS cluster assembly NifU N-terminal domain-containing protein n=1 Tax=Candidatus Lloydbacteria bacterium RIFCSPLOWO2_01_FULL_50_20 TaxID=1798665 RepID=A0A1G2DIW9_9BACT|nr:MAG: hypothetical protein A3C13_03510 [Candidatus Lloydbacteria bacterium RIFCSPHIGHO2_02_FULL_50_11]OGZ13607.1 MAG: hypothetical protein A2942_04650 [Candidatus Lloydbacteria bacterium RIFCSPLOWO2_01_FULL_50_20]
MDPLYQEHILEHYRHPHNRGRLEDFDVKHKGVNVSCGDDLTLYLKWGLPAEGSAQERGTVLKDIAFEGFGCAISQSGASMLSDKVKGMTKEAIRVFEPADMYALYGTTISPAREKCALLALHTLKEALGK